jgi:hypothetical protein
VFSNYVCFVDEINATEVTKICIQGFVIVRSRCYYQGDQIEDEMNGNVACMMEMRIHTGIEKNLKGIDYLEDADTVCRIILKWTLKEIGRGLY